MRTHQDNLAKILLRQVAVEVADQDVASGVHVVLDLICDFWRRRDERRTLAGTLRRSRLRRRVAPSLLRLVRGVDDSFAHRTVGLIDCRTSGPGPGGRLSGLRRTCARWAEGRSPLARAERRRRRRGGLARRWLRRAEKRVLVEASEAGLAGSTGGRSEGRRTKRGVGEGRCLLEVASGAHDPRRVRRDAGRGGRGGNWLAMLRSWRGRGTVEARRVHTRARRLVLAAYRTREALDRLRRALPSREQQGDVREAVPTSDSSSSSRTDSRASPGPRMPPEGENQP